MELDPLAGRERGAQIFLDGWAMVAPGQPDLAADRKRAMVAGAVHTVTGRLDNATDQLYRNHLSLIKEFVPEMGRNFRLVYSMSF